MLRYKSLHSKIEEQETNAIYYLLRKFGLLQETIILSEISSVTGEYGVYSYDAENNTLVISNAEPITNYKVVFTILDGDNNARTVSVTGKETNGSVNITVPTIATDELLLEKIKVIITYAQEILQDYIINEPSEVTGTGGEYITIADLSNNDLPDRFILSFDYKSNYESRVGLFSKENFTGNPNYSIFIGMPPDILYHYYGFRTTSTQTTDVTGRIREYSHFTIERNGDTFKFTRNGVVLGSKTINWFDDYGYVMGLMQWGSGYEHSVKNVQMVALPDEINLNVVSDKDIIQSSESATVTATLTKNGVAVTGETLSYTVKHGTTTIDSGTVTTGSDGEAEITYTGTGVGEVNITVEYGTLLQETYELWDTLFYDDGVSGTNTKWDCLFVTKSSESNGMKFLVTSTSASARASMNPVDNASVYDFDAQPMVFECYLADLYIPSNQIGMQFIQTGSNPNKQMNFSTQDIGHTIKVVYDGTSLIKYRDDVEVSRTSVTYTDKIRVGFTFYSVDGYIIVRDVKAYPI